MTALVSWSHGAGASLSHAIGLTDQVLADAV
jgi:hypothetical protein